MAALISWRRGVCAALAVTGAAVGVVSASIAHREPGYSLSGGSATHIAVGLAAGWLLLAVGIVAVGGRREQTVGALLVAASFAWFLVEWNNPGARFALVFTLGLALYVAAPPLVAHAVLAHPGGRVRSWPSRLGLAFAYGGGVLLLGVLAASVFDPAAEGCAECPDNLLLVDGNRGAYESISRVGVYLGLAWSLLLILVAVAAAARSTPGRRPLAVPVVAAGSAYLALVAAAFAHSLDRGFLGNDGVDRRLWLGEAAALLGLALAVTWGWLRARRMRSKVARLVIELAAARSPDGSLRDVLAETLGDPSLQLAYPLGDGGFGDVHGRRLQLEGETTPLIRGGERVALLSHRPGLLDDPGLVEEVAAAARLALENERLQAEVRARLEDLRASRIRIIESGDAERRRLERDLHDGAQQRLVSLSLALRLARARLGADRDPARLDRIDEAEAELRLALAELRELAHGIFPAALADEGLAAAIEALADNAPIPIEITELLDERLSRAAEAAGYFVVSEAVRRGGATALEVGATLRAGRLVIDVEGEFAPPRLVDAEDRVGALDGTLEIVRGPGGTATIHAEIPCAQ